MPLKGQEGNLPPFPVDCLPTVLRDYVWAVAEHSQTAVDMAAVIGLGVLAVCLQGKYVVEIEAARQQEEQMKQRVKELAPSIKDLEHFADKYSKDAEKVLPEAGALESAKTYREKKAKPVYEKIITVLWDTYKQFKDLIRKYNRLVTLYNSKSEDYDRLAGRCRWLEDENEQVTGKLQTAERDLSRVRRVLGDTTVDNALFAAERMEQEAEYRERLLAQQRRASRRNYPSL